MHLDVNRKIEHWTFKFNLREYNHHLKVYSQVRQPLRVTYEVYRLIEEHLA